ncbi:MAG: tetratricopeptide repeat protein, partial [Ignavibacteriaceae bacterium]|nr:tetratricopeptide repeat protein [Ignavibacteriaceae bacterium]
DNAILNFKSYINAESGFDQAHYDLAICYKEKERFEEAITSFSQAIEINPKFELAYFERGLLQHKVNDKDGGCADLKKALEMGYLQASEFISDLCEEKKL